MSDIIVRVPVEGYLSDSYRDRSGTAELQVVEAFGEPYLSIKSTVDGDFGISMSDLRRALRALDDGEES